MEGMVESMKCKRMKNGGPKEVKEKYIECPHKNKVNYLMWNP
jgi:hypothetical protein